MKKPIMGDYQDQDTYDLNKYSIDQNDYIDHLEDEKSKSEKRYIQAVGGRKEFREMYRKSLDENKSLRKALKAISKVTEDAELPLLKAVHQISFKTLKAVK